MTPRDLIEWSITVVGVSITLMIAALAVSMIELIVFGFIDRIRDALANKENAK